MLCQVTSLPCENVSCLIGLLLHYWHALLQITSQNWWISHLHQGCSKRRCDRAVKEALDTGERCAAALQLALGGSELRVTGRQLNSDYSRQASCMPRLLNQCLCPVTCQAPL